MPCSMLKAFPLKSGTRQRCPICSLLFDIVLEVLWERLKAGGEADDRGWDGWMASPTRWTWVWASSRSWWWTGKPRMMQSMGLQSVRWDWATELTDWLEVLVTEARQGKEIKSIQTGREEVKLSLFQMTWYIQNSNVSTKELLELIKEFSKAEGYKINIKKYIVFLSKKVH